MDRYHKGVMSARLPLFVTPGNRLERALTPAAGRFPAAD
jgi:hypothetical protein